MEQIDIFYFINLERRNDRLREIVEEFTKMNMPLEKIVRVNAFEHKIGVIGCSKSHIWTIKHFIDSCKERCMILEDDFKFTETREKVDEVLRAIFSSGVEIDCLLLSGTPISVSNVSNPYLLKINYATTTAGYILTKEYAPKLLHNFMEGIEKQEKWVSAFNEPENVFNLDVYWGHEQNRRNFYLTVPTLGQQRDSPSDIIGSSKGSIYYMK
jgi:GR25 family glycosyltransferase involved in LPS biosynthesis